MHAASRACAALIGTALLLVSPRILADSTAIPPTRDNSMFQSDPGSSCGLGPLFSGQTRFAGPRRALLFFDVAGSIPAGSTVNAVSMKMEVLRSGPSSAPTDPYTLHPALADWGEAGSACSLGTGVLALPGDATWEQRFYPSVNWTTTGGDLVASASGSIAMPTTGTMIWPSQPGMVADVQSWLDNPGTNFGWVLVGSELLPGTARELDSREGANPPLLDIDFTPPVSGPPEVPDGRHAPAVRVSKLSADGANLRVDWDAALCSGNLGHHIVYGTRSGFPASPGGTYVLSGSACAIGAAAPFSWIGAPDPSVLDPVRRMLWLLVVADDASTTEGAWGKNSALLERSGPGIGGSSGQCGITAKSLANACGLVP